MTWLAIGQQTAQAKKVLLSHSFDIFILYVTSAYRTIFDQFPQSLVLRSMLNLNVSKLVYSELSHSQIPLRRKAGSSI